MRARLPTALVTALTYAGRRALLLASWLLTLTSFAAPRPAAPDSLRRLPRYPLATQLRLTATPRTVVPATAATWEALARRPGLARAVRLNVLDNLGIYYIDQNQPSLAIPHLLEALRSASARDTAHASFSAMWLGYCYYLLRQPRLGLPYARQALRLLAADPPLGRDDLTGAYAIAGDCASLLPNLTLAAGYYQQVLRRTQARRSLPNVAVAWTNLASLALRQQHLALATRQLDSAHRLLAGHRWPHLDNIEDQLRGDLALRQHRYAAAAAGLRRAWEFSHRDHNRNAELLQLRLLVQAEQAQGHLAPALRYQQRLVLLQDSLFEQAAYRHAQELQTLFETSRKEQQLARQQQHIASLQLRAATLSQRTTLLWGLLLGASLLLLGLLAWQRARHQLATAAETLRVRSRIAADLHDEVGTLLARVSMQAELLHQASPVPGHALDRLLANCRAAARTLRDIVWSIDAEADTVGALLDRMRDHLDQTAAPAGLPTALTTPGLSDTDPLPGEVRQHLYLIFKEAVTNAARHARGATQLTVTLARAADALVLTVANDGPRAPLPAPPRSSMGLRNMRQRARALDGTLVAESLPEGGFLVQLRLPTA